MLLFRELGRHLATPNLLAAVLSVHAAHAAGLSELAEVFASGVSRPALLIAQSELRAGVESSVYVIDGAESDWALVWDDSAAWLVKRKNLRQRQIVNGTDSSIPMESATLDVAEATLCAGTDTALRADVLIAALQVGQAEAARDMGVEYAKVREQFGRSIGSFQSIKHRCADMAVASEAAWCMTVMAGVLVRDGAADALREAAAARLLAQRAAEENAASNIQIHGAMGFSAECIAHHYIKRALLLKHVGASRTPYAALLA
jgi:Acyl-CoA dehydrogenase, C-terminal domain